MPLPSLRYPLGLTKMTEKAIVVAHVLATLSSWALAIIISTEAQQRCITPGNMDTLGLFLVLVQLGAMWLPYVGYHKAGGPVLFPPISCANHFSWPRRVGTWVAFTVLAGGMHAWMVLTCSGNPMQTEALAMVFSCAPSAGLVLLAGNPVPMRDYTMRVVARGTEVEWLTPAAFSHSVSELKARNRSVIRCLMAMHLLGAVSLITVPCVGGLLRNEWYTKAWSCLALALLYPGFNRQVPIYRIADTVLDTKVMDTGTGTTRGWKNKINSSRLGTAPWKLINVLGVAEHLLLNALMLVLLSYQQCREVQGPAGWASRAIALLWNVGFASWGGKWGLSKLLEASNKHSTTRDREAER